MHARKVSHKILNNGYPWMRQNRSTALTEVVLAAIGERRLSVTGLDRAIDSDAHSQQHLQYQSNTVKDRRVLSVIYIGLRVAFVRRFEFALTEIRTVLRILHETFFEHGEGW